MQALAQTLVSLQTAQNLITQGKTLSIAADEALLRQLPPGNWIGGSTPYFVTERGGVTSKDKVFVSEMPPNEHIRIKTYHLDDLKQICTDAPNNGISLMVLPAFSEVHAAFAQNGPDYEDMYLKPLVGWVCGVHLDDLTTAKAKVVNGQTGEVLENAALVMHVSLPTHKYAFIDIVNPFTPSESDFFVFPKDGFFAETCRLSNGKDINFHDWVVASGVDTRMPLVADYHGANINVCIQALDSSAKRVSFYAPVFAGTLYRFAKRTHEDYYDALLHAFGTHNVSDGQVLFSCNCILNYNYGDLENKKLGSHYGPVTFGEIGYQLLNQTLVYLCIVDKPAQTLTIA